MMYIARDAFNRDRARLLRAADSGKAYSRAAVATRQSFSRQSVTHTVQQRTSSSLLGCAGPTQSPSMTRCAAYLPWVLDGANPAYTATLLSVLTAPARLLYRLVCECRYRASERLR